MNIEQRKAAEEKILKVLGPLNVGERAIIYKQLNASGLTLSNCDKAISTSPPGDPLPAGGAAPATAPAAADVPIWNYGFVV